MSMVTDDLRAELKRQRGSLLCAEGQVERAEATLAAHQTNAAKCRQKIAELEAAITLLERPRLDVVRGSRL